MKAPAKGYFLWVKQLLSARGCIDATSDQGCGAGVNITDSDSQTQLIWATGNGHLDVVRILVKRGVAVNVMDIEDRTPLMWATCGGHLNVVRFLVKHGAGVDVQDSEGWTPLMRAARDRHWDMVRFLVKHRAAVNVRDSECRTPLMRATRYGRLDVVRILVKHGAAVGAKDSEGWTPLMWAICYGHLDVVRFLVKHRAAVDIRDSDGRTPLIRAALDHHGDVMRFLVKYGAAVDVRDSKGRTPLMLVARFGHLDLVRFLVKNGANSNLISKDGRSTISIAAMFGRQDVVKFLLPHVRYQDRRYRKDRIDDNMEEQSTLSSSLLISPYEIEVESFIEGGNIGGDYRGKWLDADVVIKLFVDDTTSASFDVEMRSWHQLRHPNVLKLYGVCISHHHFFVCEYASKGSLPEYLKACDSEHRTPWKFLYEAALGLEYLHERKIVHSNLRGSNILIGSDGLAKLSGFGLSASSSEGRWYASGDWVRWAAPESLKGERVSFASDVYSLSMCIIEAVSGKVPFNKHSENQMKRYKESIPSSQMKRKRQEMKLTTMQGKLVLSMCRNDPCERIQIPTVVNKLEWFAEIEAAKLSHHSAQPEQEPLVNFDAFDEFKHGKTSSLWTAVQTLAAQSKNVIYRQIYHDMKLIYDTMKAKSHIWSTLQRFYDLLIEYQLALDSMSQKNRVCRLSATRARDHSVQGLHRRISQLLQLVLPQNQGAEKRETEWKRLCRQQVEIFVSEVTQACVMLSSVDSEEDRSALVSILRTELRNSDGKFTEKQLAVLQKTFNAIVSRSLKDVHLATTPEWFIPWFELEMNEDEESLGEGGFGSVIKAKWLDSEVVVKKLEIADNDAVNADKKREMRQMFEREVDIWFGLSHPHVVRLFGACHVGRPFFVCELAPNGTLVEYLRHHPDELWSKLREAALGVQYLHARGIVHGDLKGNNILIGSDGKAKVTDFGLSGVFGDDSTEMVLSGAWHWVAPECILGQKPTFASDIYSFGMCIIEALRVTNGDEFYMPWGRLLNAAVKFNVTRRHLLPHRPGNCLDQQWALIKRMCKSAPTERMLIMTVVDELEKHACGLGNHSTETDEMFGVNGELRRPLLSVSDELAEMKNWIRNCNAKEDWERGVLKKTYQLLWDRLEQVAIKLFADGGDTVDANTTIIDFTAVVQRSKIRTRAVLDVTGVIPLIKFTELALGGYALHRRLDKFMAAHAGSNEPRSLHDWTSACTIIMGMSNSSHPACSMEDYGVDEMAMVCTKMVPSTEKTAVL